MSSRARKETVANSAVLFSAWLAVVIASVSPVSPTQAVPIAYRTH